MYKNHIKLFSSFKIWSLNKSSSVIKLQKLEVEITPILNEPVTLGKYDPAMMEDISKNLEYGEFDIERYKTYKDDEGAELV